MGFNETFSEAWDTLAPYVKKFSHETSLCSDNPMELFVSAEFLVTAKDALATLAVLPLATPSTRNFAFMEKIRNHISLMASKYRYEGDWRLVGEILTNTDSLSVYQTWKVILGNMTSHDFFGNFVPRMVAAMKAMRLRRRYTSVVEDTRPVKYPQRVSGYNDKGSRRPDHKWMPREAYAREELHQMPVKEPRGFAWFGVQKNRGSG